MKKFFITLAAAMAVATSSLAQIRGSITPSFNTSRVNTNVVYQQGYTRSNGTYVQGHYKTKPNNTNWDNFSTVGNININTGKIGSVARDYSIGAYNYGSGRSIHTGSRGGQYYINSNGNKTYVPKRNTSSFGW